jgi:succinyl-diaminopimelate desuccinylase
MKFHDVTNLWAIRGDPMSTRLIVFAGHTDVVPSGPPELWTYPPFDGTIKDGVLYGRGAVDMKGGIASFIVALQRFIENHPDHGGSIGIILTSDEEGKARWGTREVISELTKRGITVDMCIVGEPSSIEKLGDIVKVGRRGSLSGELTILGIQGHVAYPHLAKNPIHESIGALKDLVDMEWDKGTEDFQPTSFQISNIKSGTGATNVIPGIKKVLFNFRYSPASSDVELKERVKSVLESHNLQYSIEWSEASFPYEVSRDSELVQAAAASVQEVAGIKASLCTSGGTSDGRFVARTGAQVIELGLINKTIHKVDECVAVSDLEMLAVIYENLLTRLLLKQDGKSFPKETNLANELKYNGDMVNYL